VRNRQDTGFESERTSAEKSLTEAAAAGDRTKEARIINITEFFGQHESSLQDLATVDGTSIWAGDGIHLTSNATRVAARRLMEIVDGGAGGEEPVIKRARLESVIPAPQEPPAQPAQHAASAAAAKPAATLLWLSGQLPPAGRQTGEPSRGGRGSRGGQRGPGRGRGRGPSGPMGGHYGRWGRW
jgi:hypothetical protein